MKSVGVVASNSADLTMIDSETHVDRDLATNSDFYASGVTMLLAGSGEGGEVFLFCIATRQVQKKGGAVISNDLSIKKSLQETFTKIFQHEVTIEGKSGSTNSTAVSGLRSAQAAKLDMMQFSCSKEGKVNMGWCSNGNDDIIKVQGKRKLVVYFLEFLEHFCYIVN